jgi:hypothetical protein
MKILRNTAYIQAANCHFCLHIGTTAYIFGNRNGKGYGMRIELFTPEHIFRISPWRA